ncbi:MAG: hypothetical protein JWO82_2608 [Akkermansiaceae bacterium]|nr:hypothetical protein [Akkermansiaceae bacterium]
MLDQCLYRFRLWFLSLLVVALPWPGAVGANEEAEDFPACHQLTRKGIERLPSKLGVEFNIPAPADWGGDDWLRRPIAVIPVEGGKICATLPFVNPWDGRGTVIWTIAHQPRNLALESLEVNLTLDEAGEFEAIVIHRARGLKWEDDERGVSQLGRNDDDAETGEAFFQRAMKTYRERAEKSDEPADTARLLEGLEKMSLAIRALRQEEGEKAAALHPENPPVVAAEKYVKPREPEATQKLTARAMAGLPEKLGAAFEIPYPADWKTRQIDRQPLARIETGSGRVVVTKPVVIDKAGTIEWRTGPEGMSGLPGAATVNFDAKGELTEVYFSEGNDWSYDQSIRSARISREGSETGMELLKRATEVYRGRIGRASKPEQAKVLLEGFEKVAAALQILRTGEKAE